MVIKGTIPYEWMKENLEETMHSTGEDCMGRSYPKTLIGYGIAGVTGREENFYLWYDKNHFDKVATAFPDQIVTLDPFGPDLCPKCGERT